MNNIRGLRKVFTLEPFGKPELVVSTDGNITPDTFTKRLIGSFVLEAGKAMAKVGGLVAITRDVDKAKKFFVDFYTPDRLLIGSATIADGEADVTINADVMAIALWLFGNGFEGGSDEKGELKRILTWLDAVVDTLIVENGPAETVAAIKAANVAPKVEQPEPPEPPQAEPDHGYDRDSERCKNCDPFIRKACEKFNNIDPATGKPYRN